MANFQFDDIMKFSLIPVEARRFSVRLILRF